MTTQDNNIAAGVEPENYLFASLAPDETLEETAQDLSEDEKEAQIEAEDDLHEVQVDDDINEPDPEGDY